MLDAHRLAVSRVHPARDVAGGDDAGHARRARRVADDAVLHLDARALEPRSFRSHADADHDEIRGQHAAVGEPHALDAALALDRGDGDSRAHVHPVIAVDRGVERAQLGAERLLERIAERFDHRHRRAALATRRGDLRADEASAHHDDARPGFERVADRERVVECAQHEDAGELG